MGSTKELYRGLCAHEGRDAELMTGGGREAVGSFDLPRLETWNQIWLVGKSRRSSFAFLSRSIDYKAGLALASQDLFMYYVCSLRTI